MGARVLIVDADPDAARATHAVVMQAAPDAQIVKKLTADSAWQHVQRRPPDVLIVDPSAPEAAGLLLIELCKEAFPNIRTVVVASAPTPALRAHVVSLGVDIYVEKPELVASDMLASLLRASVARQPVR